MKKSKRQYIIEFRKNGRLRRRFIYAKSLKGAKRIFKKYMKPYRKYNILEDEIYRKFNDINKGE